MILESKTGRDSFFFRFDIHKSKIKGFDIPSV